jgi:DNA polymerase-3 subunit epsilon
MTAAAATHPAQLVRHIVLDTETTGIDPTIDKIVEVGAVELVNYAPTGKTYHVYCNPGIPMPAEATAVHGLTDAFLAGHPPFDPAPLTAFLGDSPIVAHNAQFDMGFLRAAVGELKNEVIDSLAIARRKHPGASCSLDALCRRYGIDASARAKHGALVDAELLAAVYVELLSSQSALDLEVRHDESEGGVVAYNIRNLPPRITEEEVAAHAAMVATIPGSIWPTFADTPPTR